jgi:hypothetical protein
MFDSELNGSVLVTPNVTTTIFVLAEVFANDTVGVGLGNPVPPVKLAGI